MSESQESLRNSRSYSSKSQTQQFLFPSRLKRRTLSLPSSKPVIAHFLTVQDHLNKRKTDSEEDRRELNKGNMGTWLKLYFNAVMINWTENVNLDPTALLLTEGEKSSGEPWNKVSSHWFLWRRIKRVSNCCIHVSTRSERAPIFVYKNPTVHVLLHKVSQSHPKALVTRIQKMWQNSELENVGATTSFSSLIPFLFVYFCCF